MKKIKRLLFISLFFIVFLLVAKPGGAASAYITDSFKITLRFGPSVEYKIIAMLSSGQPVEVIETDGDWSRVLVPKEGAESIEGWVLSQFLTTRLPFEMQVKSLQKENALLKEKLPLAEKKLGEALNKEKSLDQSLKNKTAEFDKLQKEYEALKKGSVHYLKLKEQYDMTKASLETLQKDVQGLVRENKKLKSSQNHIWFLAGAGVLVVGLLIGLLFGRGQKRRKSHTYTIPG